MKQYAGDFEVHLTAATCSEESLSHFQNWCAERHLKCVRIVLSRGEHVEQPMATWRRGETTLAPVLEEANQYAQEAASDGLTITRVKIETGPFNEGLPQQDDDSQQEHNYFEHHIKLQRSVSSPQADLLELCEKHGAHLSRNAFRESKNAMEERFVTFRTYQIGQITSNERLQRLLSSLNRIGEQILETESEYCVYDSNVALDQGWLSLSDSHSATPLHEQDPA